MIWQPLGHGVEGVYLTTPLGRRVGYGVWVYRYRGLLVDAGPALASRFEPRAEAILLTHAHEDHSGGAARLGLPVYAGPETQALLENPRPLPLYRLLVWGPMPRLKVQRAERVGPLVFLPTPGHSPDHMALWDPEEGVAFSGDLFLGVRASLAVQGFSLKDLKASLKRVLELQPRALFCAHVGRVEEPLKALRAKLEFLEKKQEEALRLKAQGASEGEILRALFGREDPVAWVSRGEMSRRRFVRALIMEG